MKLERDEILSALDEIGFPDYAAEKELTEYENSIRAGALRQASDNVRSAIPLAMYRDSVLHFAEWLDSVANSIDTR